jgi:hypothetical protein
MCNLFYADVDKKDEYDFSFPIYYGILIPLDHLRIIYLILWWSIRELF